MTNVILANGKTVQAYIVTKQTPPPQIHIYPAEMTSREIYQTFDDPEATETVICETEKTDPETGDTIIERKTYNGYTELFSVQKSMYHPDAKEYMVWLQKPEETEE